MFCPLLKVIHKIVEHQSHSWLPKTVSLIPRYHSKTPQWKFYWENGTIIFHKMWLLCPENSMGSHNYYRYHIEVLTWWYVQYLNFKEKNGTRKDWPSKILIGSGHNRGLSGKVCEVTFVTTPRPCYWGFDSQCQSKQFLTVARKGCPFIPLAHCSFFTTKV